MAIVRWSPLWELGTVDQRMKRLFDEALVAPAVPSADVYETDEEFVVELDVPGFERGELEIEVTDHTLCVKGVKAQTKEETEKSFQLRERLETSFERRFRLPAEVDLDKVNATFGKGVLEVHAKRIKEVAPKRVAIASK